MFCKQYKMKLIAASLGLVASVHAYAAMGGMQVHSRLNEPFSATVVVTGDEARALAGSAKPTINGANLNATVTRQGADRAVIRLRSSAPIKEPVMTFWLGVGNQNHQYTAMLDPRDYQHPDAAANHTRRERRAEAEPSRRRSSRHQERAGRREAPVQIQGRSYQIKDGELLVDIAEQVKPSGMTLRQTINALVAANPRAFRNGNPDLMYRGATLIIPDAATLRRLAHNPPRRVTTSSERAAADTAPAVQQPPVTTAPTPPVETKPAASVQQPVTPPPAPPVEPAQPPQPAVPPAVSEPVAEVPASNVLPADQAEVVASMPEQASDMMVSEPVVEPAPPVVAPPVVEEPPMEEEGMDIMQMAMYGGGGLLVLGGLAYLLLNRRRKGAAPKRGRTAVDEEDDDDDDLYFESVTDHSDSIAAAPIAPAAPAPQPAPAAPVAPQPTVSEEDLGLDLSHLDEQQQLGSTPSTTEAAQQAEADDWSWLAQAEEEPAAPAQAAAPAAPVAETPAAEDEWLNFGSEEPADVGAPVEAASAAAPAETAEGLDWVLDETPAAVPQSFQTEPAPTVDFDVPAQPEAPAVEDTALSFEMPELDSASPQHEEAPAASNTMDFNLDFDTPSAPAAEPVVETAPAAQPAAVADEPAVAGPLPKEALEAKLELAKMYLEIDDANTARQTLLELINESEGSSIQAQAQALLNDIGH